MSVTTSAGTRTEYELDKLPSKMMNNRVLVKINFNPMEDVVRESGIILSGIGGTNWNESAHMARYGEVVMIPDKLVFKEKGNFSRFMMEWGTEIEISVGDVVYFGASISATADSFSYEGALYFAIPYSRLILAKRGEEIIMLNGYCLLEEVIDKVRADGLILDHTDTVNRKRGKVIKNGTNNKWYQGEDAVDAEVEVGDVLLFSNNFFGYLEDKLFNTFDNKIGYSQKRWVIAKLN